VFVKIKLLEQLGLHAYAVSTHPDELVLEPPLKKILDPPVELCGNYIVHCLFLLISLGSELVRVSLMTRQS